MTELNFSGSSVAIGAMTRARSASSRPNDVARCSTAPTKKYAPTMISPSAARTWTLTIRRRGGAAGILDVARVEVAEAERREVLQVDARVGLEMALHVPDVDPDQDGGDDPFQPGRFERQERRPDRDRVGDREVAHVVGEDACVDRHHVARRPPPGDDEDRDARDEHRQRREHERRPEDRPDADAVRRLGAAAGQDRDDRDHRLREGRPDGREDRPDGALGELELPPEPLDPVREQLGADQDDDERADEDEDVHGSGLDALGQHDAEGDDREDRAPRPAPSSVRRAGRIR